jgi:hypothetical protein
MYRKDLLKEWSSGHLASCGWYLDCPTNNTLKLEHRLRGKFEGTHLDKLTSTNFSFRGGKKNKSAKKLRKTKDQFARPSSDKKDEEDVEHKEFTPNPKGLQSWTIHQRR